MDTSEAYVKHLLSYVDAGALKPLKIVVDAGNGGAGRIVDLLEPQLPFEFVKLHHEPDGIFRTASRIRCWRKIAAPRLPPCASTAPTWASPGTAISTAASSSMLRDVSSRATTSLACSPRPSSQRHPGEAIVHDPRLTWNTRDIIERCGGTPVQSKTGHAFIKERMRAENAIYGGEMSAHHYFREFAYCDSGMIPWLLVAALISRSDRSLAELVEARMQAFPCSGEINRRHRGPARRAGGGRRNATARARSALSTSMA
jgi:phosphomannomutase